MLEFALSSTSSSILVVSSSKILCRRLKFITLKVIESLGILDIVERTTESSIHLNIGEGVVIRFVPRIYLDKGMQGAHYVVYHDKDEDS